MLTRKVAEPLTATITLVTYIYTSSIKVISAAPQAPYSRDQLVRRLQLRSGRGLFVRCVRSPHPTPPTPCRFLFSCCQILLCAGASIRFCSCTALEPPWACPRNLLVFGGNNTPRHVTVREGACADAR